MPDIKTQISNIRLQLLDLGLRGNTLLHFAPRSKAVHVIDEKSSQIFDVMVNSNKNMSFLPVPEVYEENDESAEELIEVSMEPSDPEEDDDGAVIEEPVDLPPLEDYLEQSKGDSRHQDLYLQTKLDAEKLDLTLLKIDNEAHTILQETGLDALYLSLGFLCWFESDSSEKERFAPLVLIPVELNRTSARSTFKLGYTGLDLSPNETLYAKMKNDFRITLPEWNDDFDIEDYFKKVEKAIEGKERWSVVHDKASLGFFSFGKFQMYKDLDAERWPKGNGPEQHDIINALFDQGFEKDSAQLVGVEDAEEIKSPEDLVLVKDCDSSQTEAIVAINREANLVIQGPPGTGKSQTITNIISDNLAKGKRILFVAQKMAALEVVKHRLDECHLGDAVLELHSHKSKPRQVLDSLKTTIYQDKPSIPDRSREEQELKSVKGQLDAYVEGISKPIKGSGANYIDALGTFMMHRNSWQGLGEADLNTQTMVNWGEDQRCKVELLLKGLEDHLKDMGLPKEHPFIESDLKDLSPIDQEKLSMKFKHGCALLESMEESIKALAGEMNFPKPEIIGDIYALVNAARRATEAPPLKGIELHKVDWVERYDAIMKALNAGKRADELKSTLAQSFMEPFFDMDPLPIRADLMGSVGKWYRFILPSYRRAKSMLASVYKESLPSDPKLWLKAVEDLMQLQTLTKECQNSESTLKPLFGVQWQGMDSNWEVLLTLCKWIVDLHQDINSGELPEMMQQFLSGGDQFSHLEPFLNKSEDGLSKWNELKNDLMVALALRSDALLASDQEIGIKDLSDKFELWNSKLSSLYSMTRLNRICQDFQEMGEEQISSRILSWSHPVEQFKHFILMNYWAGIVNTTYNEHDVLKQFDRVAHEGAIQSFSQRDAQCFVHAQENLVSTLYNNLPSRNAPGEMEIIRRELNKKRRYLPVRKLLDQAGRVIQKVKPIFMMSPMSVSSFLPPGKIDFDLVIFDEASQLTAPDAIGSIARGNQIVVVGDSQQMPPSSFFGKSVELDDEEAEQDVTADIESILSLFIAQGCPEKMLQWHYRSKHDSLIATSNKEFYDGRLKVFPNSGQNVNATGLHFHHLPDTIYDRGNTRSNKGEAQAIAKAVMEHARNKPKLSLGVVAFSMAQKDAILVEVEILRRQDDSLEPFFKHHESGEEFFVKNLENVQGDERDVIMISIGYGRTKAGKVPKSFGPINRERGERRLNVLISRAKMAMDVFCNFTADDLPIKADSPRGVKVLKSFLHYAEKGELELPQETGREMDSPFEEEVYKAVKDLGFDVVTQVGSQGFYIDLAIRHPEHPGKYILAIECDGASYHSSANARDRDRLRQSVLESVGWRIHRIWSTDWFRNAKAETQRVKELVELILSNEKKGIEIEKKQPPAQGSAANIKRVMVEEGGESGDAPELYTNADLSVLGLDRYEQFHEIPDGTVKAAIKLILKTEAPIHQQVLTIRLIGAVGLTRAGAKIKRIITTALGELDRAKECALDGEFVLGVDSPELMVRNRSECPTNERKLEHVSPLELSVAILNMVELSHSIKESDLLSEVGNQFGFSRVTSQMSAQMKTVLDELMQTEKLQSNGDTIQLRSF
jgi:very-short-patch-repair endonuclease